MTAPNVNTLWGRAIVEEIVAAGVRSVCIAPGSRSTPLTVAFARREEITVHSHLDERAAAFFALGRAKRTGEPTPLVCTSGTAAAEFHPAVIEADRARVPMLLLTADRPPELWDSGANQTVGQAELYGSAVRRYRTLPEPEADGRKLRSLRTTVSRALEAGSRSPCGPVHLNVPFRKPLGPTETRDHVTDDFVESHPRGASGRSGRYVEPVSGSPTLGDDSLDGIVDALMGAERPLIVVGPADAPTPDRESLATLLDTAGIPVLADPLSGHRFGPHVSGRPICGGYDAYLDGEITAGWPDPDVVLRFGASPTSKTLRSYLERSDPRQFLVDPAGGCREATFAATDLVTADPSWLARSVADRLGPAPEGWRRRFERAEARYWELIEARRPFEGSIVAAAVGSAPDPATVFVSNSTPVRDMDRFARPRPADLATLGNRGASGIDGITSTALGAGSAVREPLVLVTGDLAYYHDMNGLLALERCDVEATIVEINNDGGGIFHMLPIEAHDTFEDHFKTPHGLDFSATGALYDLEFERVDGLETFRSAYADSVGAGGTQVIEVESDAEANHREREALQDRVVDELAAMSFQG